MKMTLKEGQILFREKALIEKYLKKVSKTALFSRIEF